MDSAKHFRDGEPAIILFAHGSAMEEANEGVRDLAMKVQDAGAYAYVRASFLGPGQPELGHVIAEAVGAGFESVVVIPFFLTLGTHLRRDLPKLIAAERQKYPQLEIQVGRSLEDHPEMASLILRRIREAREEVKTSR